MHSTYLFLLLAAFGCSPAPIVITSSGNDLERVDAAPCDINGDGEDDTFFVAAEYLDCGSGVEGGIFSLQPGESSSLSSDCASDLIFQGATSHPVTQVSCGDVDGDGYDDLVAGFDWSSTASGVVIPGPLDQYSGWTDWSTIGVYTNTSIFTSVADVLTEDLDGDSIDDIIWVVNDDYAGDEHYRSYVMVVYGPVNRDWHIDDNTGYDVRLRDRDVYEDEIAVTVCDFDGNGADLVIGNVDSVTYGQGAVHILNNIGSLSLDGHVTAAADITIQESGTSGYFGRQLECIDMDGDSRDELMIGGQGLWFFSGIERVASGVRPISSFNNLLTGNYGYGNSQLTDAEFTWINGLPYALVAVDNSTSHGVSVVPLQDIFNTQTSGFRLSSAEVNFASSAGPLCADSIWPWDVDGDPSTAEVVSHCDGASPSVELMHVSP